MQGGDRIWTIASKEGKVGGEDTRGFKRLCKEEGSGHSACQWCWRSFVIRILEGVKCKERTSECNASN